MVKYMGLPDLEKHLQLPDAPKSLENDDFYKEISEYLRNGKR
jgi:hypothetical protein